MLQAWEWTSIAKGTREKVWAHRDKAPLLGWVKEGGADCHRNLPMHMCVSLPGPQRVGCLWCRSQVVRSHLLRLRKTGHFLYRPQVGSHNLCGQRAVEG